MPETDQVQAAATTSLPGRRGPEAVAPGALPTATGTAAAPGGTGGSGGGGAPTREQEMLIEFKSGSVWQLVGSDNYNSLMGSPPRGIVYSEYSIANPMAWAYLMPILYNSKSIPNDLVCAGSQDQEIRCPYGYC